MSETANPSPHIYSVSGYRKILLQLASKTVRRWQESLQYRFSMNFSPDILQEDSGALILLWHNRLFMGSGALRQSVLRNRPLHALVSASRDGAQLSVFLKGQGVWPIRGSSSRRGASATRELLKVLSQGHNVAITVDGPRGPCYKAQAGAALLVQVTGAPVYFFGAESENCQTLNSWDRFIVPRPFSRVNITLDRYTHPSIAGGKEERITIQELIQKKLSALTRDIHSRDC